MSRSLSTLASLALATSALAPAMGSAAAQTIETEEASVRVDTIVEGLRHPWGLAFLPEGGLLVTERSGNLRHLSTDGRLTDPISGVPDVDAREQGGLLDVAIDPDFADNRLVYLSYAEPGERGTNSTAVARGRLSEDATALSDVTVIFSQQPKLPSTKHFGSRLVFDGNGHLFITTGERSEARFRGQSQDLGSHLGKVIRIHPDGTVPQDNPFIGTEGALPEIWSYGHRNIQGAALHPETGALWLNEHGPRGGDEVNIAEAGKNYGWPVVTFGVNYDGTPVGSGESSAPGMEDPIHQWTPVIGASGMTFYTSDAVPGWRGSVFNGGLVTRNVVRLVLDGATVTHEERMLGEIGRRIRLVKEGPSGELFLLTDEPNGAILRVTPQPG